MRLYTRLALLLAVFVTVAAPLHAQTTQPEVKIFSAYDITYEANGQTYKLIEVSMKMWAADGWDVISTFQDKTYAATPTTVQAAALDGYRLVFFVMQKRAVAVAPVVASTPTAQPAKIGVEALPECSMGGSPGTGWVHIPGADGGGWVPSTHSRASEGDCQAR